MGGLPLSLEGRLFGVRLVRNSCQREESELFCHLRERKVPDSGKEQLIISQPPSRNICFFSGP